MSLASTKNTWARLASFELDQSGAVAMTQNKRPPRVRMMVQRKANKTCCATATPKWNLSIAPLFHTPNRYGSS